MIQSLGEGISDTDALTHVSDEIITTRPGRISLKIALMPEIKVLDGSNEEANFQALFERRLTKLTEG